MSDAIEIRDLQVLVFCGVLDEEQERRQPFSIDIDLYLDLTAAGESDNLDDTVDYGALIAELMAVVDVRRFNLLEALAATVAEVALRSGPVTSVSVKVEKVRPPVPAHVATTGVRITRSR